MYSTEQRTLAKAVEKQQPLKLSTPESTHGAKASTSAAAYTYQLAAQTHPKP